MVTRAHTFDLGTTSNEYTHDHDDLNEAVPMVVSYKHYNAADGQPYAHNISSGFTRQHSLLDSHGKTMHGRSFMDSHAARSYINSVTHSLHLVSQSMFFPGAVDDPMAYKTLSMVDLPSPERIMSKKLIFMTLMNLIMVSSIFALPYLAAHAGVTILVSIVVIGLFTMYTGLLVHTCQYQTSKSQPGVEKRVYSSFVDMGKAALPYGEVIMQVLLYTNLLTDTATIVYLGLVTMTFFAEPTELMRQVSLVIWCVLLIPLMLITNKNILNWFVTAGMVCYILALGTLYGELATTAKTWKAENLHLKFDWEIFILGYGIILHTFNCHILLPGIEANAKQPESYRSVFKFTYAVNIAFKLVLAAMGVATYGTKVTNGLLPNMSGFGVIHMIACVLTIVYLYTSRPRSMIVVAELLDSDLQPKMGEVMQKENKGYYFWHVLSRTFVVAIVLFFAVALPRFELVVAFAGFSRGTANAIVCPLAFYLRLRGRHLSKFSYVVHAALLVLALLFGLLGTVIFIRAWIIGRKDITILSEFEQLFYN